jgi:hypothetical protein
MIPMSYPRRQQNRRLVRALKHACIALAALSAAALVAGSGLSGLAGLLLLLGTVSALRSRQSLRLARRSAVGARSEQQVRAQLRELTREGWRVRHSLRWRGGGDIDHVAIAPSGSGLAFPIETKTRRYARGDLDRIDAVAQWIVRRRSSWCRQGAIPIVCLVETRGIERWEGGVAVVSADRLVTLLRRLAGTTRKPGFLR